ncbi:unnamed protein product [Calicophoron daubneyi]|uniref:E3 ubiquitin-protein ligase MARCHF5 n=1 Tax=Calicophoron daubneyi TaxID=300641 RepID=A0AAV2T8G2_CALDB
MDHAQDNLNGPSSALSSEDNDERTCWICLDTGLGEEPNEAWSHPCHCSGALKWVHRSCLQRWIDERQSRGGQSAPVFCRACGDKYDIVYPEAGPLFMILEALDGKTRVISYYFTGALALGTVYWSAVTYGAVTVMQVLGHREGLRTMEQADPLLLLLLLPSIPLCLILGKAIPWESGIRLLWRRFVRPITAELWFARQKPNSWPPREYAIEPASEGYEFPRVLCSALALPTIATVTGQFLYRRVRSDFSRILLGGLTYLLVKGVLSVSYSEMRYMRTCYREVRDCEN